MSALRKVERAAAKAAVSREALETAMREARAAKVSLRDIAKAAGVSHEQVRRILERPEVVHALGDDIAAARIQATPGS